MKGIFKYLRKVWKNADNVYEKENRTLKEAGSILIAFFACIGMLVLPFCRLFLEWLAYISVGSFAIFMVYAFFGSIAEIWKSFRYAKKLEKLGTSVEEEEMARRALCEMEGDDGMPPANRAKIVFFVDFGAMNYYANPLYGCFLAQEFKSEHMHLPEKAEIYTSTRELEKLREAERSCKRLFSPYIGYTNFIRANFKVLEENGNEKPIEVIPFDVENERDMDEAKDVIASALRVQRDADAVVILLSTCEEWGTLASKNGIFFVNPQKLGKK